jgi:hypothetical protein
VILICKKNVIYIYIFFFLVEIEEARYEKMNKNVNGKLHTSLSKGMFLAKSLLFHWLFRRQNKRERENVKKEGEWVLFIYSFFLFPLHITSRTKIIKIKIIKIKTSKKSHEMCVYFFLQIPSLQQKFIFTPYNSLHLIRCR